MRPGTPIRTSRPHWPRLVGLVFALTALAAHGQTVINEVLFNPPGSPDSPSEYIEIRGTPNLILSNTFLVTLEGDAEGNPGTILDVFSLGGRALGGNGFLALLQSGHSYAVTPGATILTEAGTGPGWGLANGSKTFLLIQATNLPVAGTDVDGNNNGLIDSPVLAAWTILDSVGVLDNTGPGDIAYGAINFRRNPGATASGTVVEVGFSPGYIGRSGNTAGSDAAAWVASDNLGGAAPNWTLGSSANTTPSGFAGALLNHVGGPNFGASKIPGVILTASGGSTDLAEGSGTDSYTLALNTAPAGNVVIQITAASPLQVSTDGGTSYGSSRLLTLSSTASRTVLVKAGDDNVVDTSPYARLITHVISTTADPAHYPTDMILPLARVRITENDAVLLNELKVNAPGTNDAPFEFLEIKGRPNALLTNVHLVALDGDQEQDPGEATFVVTLTSARLGANGLLLVAAPGHPYAVPPATPVVIAAQLGAVGGGLGNGTITFLLLSSPSPIIEGEDLDGGDNGVLEGLPEGTTIMDSVGWSDGGPGDLVYTLAALIQTSGTPDAASRFPGNTAPHSADAWFNGNLEGTSGDCLIYGNKNVSADFPLGSELTPGGPNDTAPTVSPLGAVSGDVDDPTNLQVLFAVDDAESGAAGVTVQATSDNPAVVPNQNLLITPGPGGSYTLTLQPVGTGYATITVAASDGTITRRVSFDYAASDVGGPGTRFHPNASDGSAAFAIDATWMIVGDDEDQGLRLYHRHQSGLPINRWDFSHLLNLVDVDDGSPKEVDLEGSTRVGNRIFWMGAHSNGAFAAVKTNRSRIFATDLSGTGASAALAFVGRYEHLKVDLLNWDASNAHGKGSDYYGLVASAAEGVDAKAPDGSGFNLEGLTMTPGSTTAAYVAFRAPLVPPTARAKALIVPVLNFATLAVGNGPSGSAQFGTPIELNLGSRGIRSIESGPAGCLLIAGPPGTANDIAPRDFRLFTWTGQPADPPDLRAANLTGRIPEGMVELPIPPWTADSQVQLINDNGITVFYGDGVEAKHLDERAFRKFRSDWVTLGAVTIPAPAILSQHLSNGVLRLTWCAVEGRTYRVEWTDALASSTWTALPGDVTATDALASKSDPVNASGQRFYRVVLVR